MHEFYPTFILDGVPIPEEEIDLACRTLKAIAHPLRLKILCVLGAYERTVQEIVNEVGTTQSNVSQHLAILRDKGMLSSRKDANKVYYRIVDTRVALLQLCSTFR